MCEEEIIQCIHRITVKVIISNESTIVPAEEYFKCTLGYVSIFFLNINVHGTYTSMLCGKVYFIKVINKVNKK